MHWYVNVKNQAYGPYSDDQMRGFVVEGRVTTNSLISNAPANGFYSAGDYDAFNLWCGQQATLQPLFAVGGASTGAHAVPAPQYEQQAAPIAQAVAQQATRHDTPVSASSVSQPIQSTTNSKSCVFLIMAEIRSDGEMAFLQTMQSFGQAERIGDTVWLVRSPRTVEQIRNTLSQTLNQQDRLFILDSKASKTAWFNIGADLDHRIRELWDEDEA